MVVQRRAERVAVVVLRKMARRVVNQPQESSRRAERFVAKPEG